RLVDELRLDRGQGETPLFRAMLALQDEGLPAVELPGLTLEPVEVDSGATKLDLVLRLNATAGDTGGLAGGFQFAAELFDRPTIGRMAGHLRALLAAAAADPGLRAHDLPLLGAAERQQLLVEWCDTERSFAFDCVHRLVEAQVERTPGAVAVVLDGAAWTYRELDARADRLARRLRELGAGPGAIVGVCLERSLEMVAALLAVLKAGGAYLPLDPDYPEDRLAFLVEDAGVRVLVARPGTAAAEALRDRVEHLVEPAAGPMGTEEAGGAPLATLDDAAYVIYTSGSTGKPKGVLVAHRAIANRLLDAQRIYRLDAGHRLLQGSAFSFDFSVWEIFAPLIAGARLVLMRPGGHRDAAYLVEVCAGQGVTHAHFVPSLLQVFLEQEGVERCRSLEAVYSGGEALSPALHRRFFERLPGALYNQYGPTEAAVDVTWWESREGVAGHVVPIGRPFANVRLYVLDPELRPVPVGVHGELHIAGAQLARGYLGRPDVTARHFIPDPFGDAGGRLYRTGDLVRFLPDGNVDYLGRVDHQVKVRGFRIELGEIEAVLAQHPGVREAAAAAVEISAGDRRLAAWIVPAGEQAPAADELRAFLGERLPEFMVPGLFVTLAALPRTGSGKLDRRALPARVRAETDVDFVAPRTPGERLLARLWSEVLGVERVGVHDNFFALGGDSILSIQVVSRANQAGLRLSPRQLFEHPTIAGLAAVAGAARTAAVDAGPVSGPVPLTPIQRELFELDLPDPHHYNQAVLLEVRRPLAAGLLRRALAALLEHHDALRLRAAREVEGWRQWIAPPGEEPALLEIGLTGIAADEKILEDIAGAVQASLDLQAGPLLRGVLFRRGTGGDRLLLVIHHLAVDGVSWRILVADLEAVCARLGRGEAPGLPPRTTSYREWAEGLVTRASDGTFAAEVEAWAAAGDAVPHLPVDEPAGARCGDNTAASARSFSVALTREETEALLREVPAAYRTRVDEVLLAALALGLRKWTGAGRLRLDVEGHGREELWPGLDLSRTVGWFTSRFPLTFSLPDGGPGDEPGAVLCAVKEQARAVPCRGIGYGVLRHLGGPAVARRLAEAPRPELSFNYLGQLDPAVAPDALFALASGPTGAARGRRGRRKHLLEVDGGIAGGRLELTWTWSAALHRRATVEALAGGVLQALRGLIEHCRTAEAGGFTPSDFPLARLDQRSLDRIAGRDRRIEDLHPLSPTQEGILFHSRLEPGTGAYFEQMACTLRGALDVPAFERAWHAVGDRHPALRSAFVWEGLDAPLQVVRRPVEIPWRHEDWSAVPESERPERLAALYREERELGFDLTRAPLMRCVLVRLAGGLHHFVWSHHHLLLDGWSLPLVLREVFTAYDALRRGRAPELEPARPFRDYVAWLQERDLAAAEAFWRRSLDGFTAPTRLEADAGPDAPRSAEEPGFASLRLAPRSAAALRSLARRQQLTLSTLVQGAWALLLHRHSGAEDVVFGATVSGRPAALPGVESIVGVFINSLPVRVRAAEESLLLPWLEELQAWQAEQREHEHSPLVQVREWSPLARDLPLFESLLIFENYPVDVALDAVAGLGVEDLRFFEQTHYPLTATVAPQEGLRLSLAHDRARFGDAAAARLLRDFAALLEGIAARPQGRLADLPWMSAAERQQLVVEWNDTEIDADAGDCIHRRFERQARRTPGAVALVFGRRQLTYAELDRQAEELAGRLRRRGVGPDVRVGLCAERSPEMVAGLLAVLKAGGAYVPLDSAYPAERLALMLEDSGARVLLTQEGLLPRLPISAGVRVLLLDEGADEGAAQGQAEPVPAGPDHLAYVIYTSGSTGRPKGVMVPHRGVLNFFAGMDARLGAEPGVWLAVTSISFDISVLELLWTLCRGFRVVLQKDAASLVAAAEAPASTGELDLSLFYFAAEEAEPGEAASDSYRLLLEGARFADRHGLAAVWTPERHFHAFGGQYPNPAVTGAAVAAITERIQIRAGSVVLPLHHPVRVAEDWAVIDRLSGGRVGLSFATGWHADDFVFAPESYPRRKEAMLQGIDTVRRLWRGEAVTFPNGAGRPLDVRIHPRPVQPELPFWLTAAGNPETFRQAGALGANLLTHLLGQTPEELGQKIALYRQAR
ncbi:MAG TPA: amino acid adenylation domain-containing protein, partial [Thermoanaerobaculia bacterium]|nr:amino acid adenylation domain-containing protein [Thermoanaerobaculia bacterium]